VFCEIHVRVKTAQRHELLHCDSFDDYDMRAECARDKLYQQYGLDESNHTVAPHFSAFALVECRTSYYFGQHVLLQIRLACQDRASESRYRHTFCT